MMMMFVVKIYDLSSFVSFVKNYSRSCSRSSSNLTNVDAMSDIVCYPTREKERESECRSLKFTVHSFDHGREVGSGRVECSKCLGIC